MRRSVKFSDYGVDLDEIDKLFKFCRDLDEYDFNMLERTAKEIAPIGLVDFLLDSIINGLSYYKLCKQYRVPISKNGFYTYRIRIMGQFYRKLRLLGRWRG